MRKSEAEPQALEIDMSEAQRAFERIEPALRQLSEDELQPFRVDIQRAAAIANAVAVRDQRTERRARFDRLAIAGFFDIELLDQLRMRALATWYARAMQVRVAELSADARVAEPVVREATEIRARMLRVLEHYFGESAEIGPLLAIIRRGSGYQDLANDLLALVELYEREDLKPLIARDPMHFRADDVAAAREHAQLIFAALGLDDAAEARRWTGQATRAWTLLVRAYDRTRAAAGLLFAADEDVSATYPPLIAASRASGQRVRAVTQETSEPV